MAKKKIKPQLIHFADMILNRPLLIHPEKLNQIMAVLGPRMGVEITGDDIIGSELTPDITLEFKGSDDRPENTDNNSAIISIHGTLTNRNLGLDSLSGLRSYEEIREEFRAALSDEDVKSIIFDIDSGGGEAAGMFDLVDEIFEARGEKPIFAIINDKALSAAFGLASAADEIIISRTGGVGSVGVIAQHVDQSEFDKKVGVKFSPIFAGARKNDFSPHSPLSSVARAKVQENVDSHYEMFTAMVARNLGVDQQKIKDTEAGLFTGQKAVDAGLAHKLMSPEDALTMISKNNEIVSTIHTKTKTESEVKIMNLAELKEKHPELIKEIQESTSAENKIAQEKAIATAVAAAEGKTDKAVSDAVAAVKVESDKTIDALGERVLTVEKDNEIRREKEIEAKAEGIFMAKLKDSDIPTRIHGKVRKHVDHNKFVTDDVLDETAFSAKCDAEIKDWETNGITKANTVQGFGTSDSDPTGGDDTPQAQEDDEAVARALRLAGDNAAADALEKEIETRH